MLQLRNNGVAIAQVYSVEITGPDSGAFWLDYNDCGGRNLNLGEARPVQVSFGPYDSRPFLASLRANSEQGTSFSAALSGEGGRAILSPALEPTGFGSTPVGSPGVTKTIEVTNVGNLPGGVLIAVISGGAVGSFHLLDESCTDVMLRPAATCSIVVNFRPLSTGVKTARLSLFGESNGGTQITLSGVGTEPEPVVVDEAVEAGAVQARSPAKHRAQARAQHRKRRLQRRQRHSRTFVAERQAIR